MTLSTRPISWIKAALKEFEKFPERAQSILLNTLTIAAEGGKSDIAKPMHAMGSGFEIALPFAVTHTASFMQCSSRRIFGSSTRFRKNRRAASRLQSATSI